ncbi:hypothetical protein AB8B02_05830 [Tardiphaga sp. 862_B3_N4_1]|uniref:hypothetical protein n=1 Tax=Tardiphaga sp. 862_B3_N4_1 TaxID=3240764 RepID=UPI003F29ACBC
MFNVGDKDTERHDDAFDTGAETKGSYRAPRQPGDKVKLRDTKTGSIAAYFSVDAREILAVENTQYEPA